jgi:hypothetical protein
VFFSHELKMIPVWFPWIFVGGILFIALSFIGSKYKNKQYKNIQFLQDFISGSILIAFLGVLMPDVFPKVDIPTVSLPSILTSSAIDDIDIQVGPPRLIGR